MQKSQTRGCLARPCLAEVQLIQAVHVAACAAVLPATSEAMPAGAVNSMLGEQGSLQYRYACCLK